MIVSSEPPSIQNLAYEPSIDNKTVKFVDSTTKQEGNLCSYCIFYELSSGRRQFTLRLYFLYGARGH